MRASAISRRRADAARQGRVRRSSEEGREDDTLQLLARRATADSWRALLGGSEVRPTLTDLVTWFDEGNAPGHHRRRRASRRHPEGGRSRASGGGATCRRSRPSPQGLVAACLEFAVEGSVAHPRIDKESGDVGRAMAAGLGGGRCCGSRYGPFHGGPDPLADPPDAGAGVDELGRRILAGDSVAEARCATSCAGDAGPRPARTWPPDGEWRPRLLRGQPWWRDVGRDRRTPAGSARDARRGARRRARGAVP